MAAFIVFIAFIWGGTMGGTLVLARFRLASGDASLWDHLLVRAVALLAVSISMLTMGLVVSRTSATANNADIVPFLWLATVIPLVIPAVRWQGITRIPSEHWVYTSVVLSAAAGFILAMTTLVRLILQNPDFV